jgi:hypothetical protein
MAELRSADAMAFHKNPGYHMKGKKRETVHVVENFLIKLPGFQRDPCPLFLSIMCCHPWFFR